MHIEAPGQSEDVDLLLMLCGLVITFDEDGNALPLGEDFYHFTAGHKADCPGCLEQWLRMA